MANHMVNMNRSLLFTLIGVVTSELEALRKCSLVIYFRTFLRNSLLNSIDLAN